MRFLILGPLEVWNHHSAVRLNGPRQQALLAALLLQANRLVPANHLIRAVWGEDSPDTARQQIRNSVSLLRRGLIASGAAPDTVICRSGGYSLQLENSELDVEEFQARRDEADRLAARGASGAALDALRSALALWRGPALAGIHSKVFEAEAARLNEQRMAVQEARLELELAFGHHRHVVDELAALVIDHPMQEGFVRQFMIALYRSGRQADALEQFHRVRRRLADELGLDARAELSQLYLQILRRSPGLEAPPGRLSCEGVRMSTRV
jgi:DNA-binding SARP family transcriptional activator